MLHASAISYFPFCSFTYNGTRHNQFSILNAIMYLSRVTTASSNLGCPLFKPRTEELQVVLVFSDSFCALTFNKLLSYPLQLKIQSYSLSTLRSLQLKNFVNLRMIHPLCVTDNKNPRKSKHNSCFPVLISTTGFDMISHHQVELTLE
jgi:hypothetical protein